MQCACAILSSVACPALPYFLHCHINDDTIFGGVIEYKMCILIFSTDFACKIPNSKENSARYHKCIYVYVCVCVCVCMVLIIVRC